MVDETTTEEKKPEQVRTCERCGEPLEGEDKTKKLCSDCAITSDDIDMEEEDDTEDDEHEDLGKA